MRPRLARQIALLASGVVFVSIGAGCGGGQGIRGANPEVPSIVDLTNPSAQLPVEQFMIPLAAHIVPGDRLDVRVTNLPQLSTSYRVSPDGKVNLHLIGTVEVAGKTAEDLDQELTEKYGAYIRNLDLAVNVEEPAPRNVYVLGEVHQPGRFDFSTGDRVLHSLALAGGLTEKAREDGVVLMRRQADGQDHAYRLDFSRMHKRVAPADIYLQPGDVVFVPKSRVSTATDFSLQLIDVLGRAATTTLVIDDITGIRKRAVTVGR